MFKKVQEAHKFLEHNRDRLARIRNAVGGHFTLEAAKSAMSNIDRNTCGRLEITFNAATARGGAKLHYAGEIAASALITRLPGERAREEEVSDTLEIMREGYMHAAEAMRALVDLFVWERFV